MDELWKSLSKAFDRAIQAVGVISVLLTLAIFGALMFAFDRAPVWLAAALFGAFGTAEVFHRQRHADLINRRELPKELSLFLSILDAHPRWEPKVIKEFQYGGLRFRAFGFEELKIPLSVAEPLCPRCGGRVTERRETRFPFRHRIEHRCVCGFSQLSCQTLGELHQEAHDFAGCPK